MKKVCETFYVTIELEVNDLCCLCAIQYSMFIDVFYNIALYRMFDFQYKYTFHWWRSFARLFMLPLNWNWMTSVVYVPYRIVCSLMCFIILLCTECLIFNTNTLFIDEEVLRDFLCYHWTRNWMTSVVHVPYSIVCSLMCFIILLCTECLIFSTNTLFIDEEVLPDFLCYHWTGTEWPLLFMCHTV